MPRLTERDEFGNADIIGVDSQDLTECIYTVDELNRVTAALNKLADYEDAEETACCGAIAGSRKNTSEDFLPCPLCAAQPFEDADGADYFVTCPKCGVSVIINNPTDPPVDTRETWNDLARRITDTINGTEPRP